MKKIPWWKSTFDKKYLDTYIDIVTPPRTQEQVGFLINQLKLTQGTKVLDVGCGTGRHSIALAAHGCAVTGIDTSPLFLKYARDAAASAATQVRFEKKDMRRLKYASKFDVVISMFTSFGYFAKEADHVATLQGIASSLRPKGKFLLDVPNIIRGINTGNTAEEQTLSNGLRVTVTHELDAATMRWKTVRSWKKDGATTSYITDVRMFTLPELHHLLTHCGLAIRKTWGDFKGSAFSNDSSRLIVLAERVK